MKPLSEKLKIILNLINVSHLSYDEYVQLGNVCLNHAGFIKHMEPVEKMLAVIEENFLNDKFELGQKINFED